MKINVLACGLVAAAGCMAYAQVPAPVASAGNGLRRVSQLIGSTVGLQGSNTYGKVEDVVLNEDGTPVYMVVSNNGRHAMFPWGAGNINYGQRMVTYDVRPQAVQPLQFAPNAWPNITDEQWITRTNQVFPTGGVVRREAFRPLGPGSPVVEEKVKPNGAVKQKIVQP